MSEKKKGFSLISSVFSAVCVVLVVEATPQAGSFGNGQFFWWIFLLIAFFLPYGLVNAELGTTYTGEGGLFDWVHKAFGLRWGSRVSWYYWINFALWMASLAVLVPTVITQFVNTWDPWASAIQNGIPQMIQQHLQDYIASGVDPTDASALAAAATPDATAAFGFSIPWFVSMPIQLIFIWVITYFSNKPVAENTWLINSATVVKFILVAFLGIFGIAVLVSSGNTANPIIDDAGVNTLIPNFTNMQSISLIIFDFLGFEVVTTFAGSMDNPKKQIPQALILGGILVAFFYMLASFGLGVAIPMDQLSADTGLLDAYGFFFGTLLPASWGPIFLTIIGVLFIYTLVANLLSWELGVNYVAMYAADNHALPAVFGRKAKGTDDVPLGAAVVTGVVASILALLGTILAQFGADGMFWEFFSLQIITLLMSYIMLFPAFLKLRKSDPDRERPFKIPGGNGLAWVIGIVPVILLILGVVFSIWMPGDPGMPGFATSNFINDLTNDNVDLVLLGGTIIAIIIGELIAQMSVNKSKRLNA